SIRCLRVADRSASCVETGRPVIIPPSSSGDPTWRHSPGLEDQHHLNYGLPHNRHREEKPMQQVATRNAMSDAVAQLDPT
ncbi:MAG: hypothetical protein M3Y19_06890, partial [Actinomycetota bacterium]|nr:hypothetical protein [Actinomycetota bacterium]